MAEQDPRLKELKEMTPLPSQRFLFPCEHRVIANMDPEHPSRRVALCMAISRLSGHPRAVLTSNCAQCQLETGKCSMKYINSVSRQLLLQNLKRARLGYYPPENVLKMFKLAYDMLRSDAKGRATLRVLMEECARLNRFKESPEEVMAFVTKHMPELTNDEPIPEKTRSGFTRKNILGRFKVRDNDKPSAPPAPGA